MQVSVAVREREAAVADADRRAGNALRDMTEDQGLSVREAVERCGDEPTTREATGCVASSRTATWRAQGGCQELTWSRPRVRRAARHQGLASGTIVWKRRRMSWAPAVMT